MIREASAPSSEATLGRSHGLRAAVGIGAMTPVRARVLLVLAAAAWGLGNVPQKTVLAHIDPLMATGLRGLAGAALLLPLALAAGGWRANRGGLAGVAGLFALALTLQQASYMDASVTSASVLVNAGVVLTPFLVWALHGDRPTPAIAGAVLLAALGLGLMSGPTGVPGRGDSLALASATAFAFWTVALARHVRAGGSALVATVVQLAAAAAVALPLGLWLAWPSGEALRAAGADLALLALFPTAFAFGAAALALKVVGPTLATLVVSPEAVFGISGGMVLLGERPDASVLLGVATLLLAIALAGWRARG